MRVGAGVCALCCLHDHVTTVESGAGALRRSTCAGASTWLFRFAKDRVEQVCEIKKRPYGFLKYTAQRATAAGPGERSSPPVIGTNSNATAAHAADPPSVGAGGPSQGLPTLEPHAYAWSESPAACSSATHERRRSPGASASTRPSEATEPSHRLQPPRAAIIGDDPPLQHHVHSPGPGSCPTHMHEGDSDTRQHHVRPGQGLTVGANVMKSAAAPPNRTRCCPSPAHTASPSPPEASNP